jgi:hypothetical protein
VHTQRIWDDLSQGLRKEPVLEDKDSASALGLWDGYGWTSMNEVRWS